MKNSVKRVAQEYRKQSTRGVDILYYLLPGEAQGYYKAYREIDKQDRQSAELLQDVVSEFDKILTLSNNQSFALTRLREIVKNADKWDAANLRNQIFKAADLLGLKLPSMMFASEEKVAAGRVLKKDIRLKNNDVIPKGTSVEVKFLGRNDKDGYRMCELTLVFEGASGRNYAHSPMKLQITSLEAYVTGFKAPGMRALEKWSDDGVALTPTGKRVEPDGYGPDGSPSWLLAMGMI